MPVRTNNYHLEAFLQGDSYSSIVDKRRFTTIDNQLNAITTIIGDGVLDGWDIELLIFPNIRVTSGSGFIDKFYVDILKDYDFELSSSGTFYVYAQRRVGVIGTESPKSDVSIVTYIDSGPPNAPSGFTASVPSSLDEFFNIQLSWNANSEIDFDHYEIERSTDSVDFELINSITDTSFTDSVDEDTTYYYRLYAVDQSGFRSSYSSLVYTTQLSPVLPPDPLEVIMASSENAINILWKRPLYNFAKILNWELSWVRLNPDGSEISSTYRERTIDKNLYFERIDDLVNGEIYKVTLKTKDIKNRLSGGIVKNVVPQFSTAPKDPKNIIVSDTELVAKSVILDVSWTDGADEYDPLIPYRYNIYVTIDGQKESLPINVPISFINEQVELYTFDLIRYFSIPQNTLITLRITSVSQNGMESFGNYLRFVTADFSSPLPVKNLDSTFDFGLGRIFVTWDNNLDTSNIVIKITDNNLNDDYPAFETINESIGITDKFSFSATINHVYIITVIPYNSSGTIGSLDTTTEITSLTSETSRPEIPRELFSKIGDKQVSFNWTPSSNLSTAYYNVYKKTGRITFDYLDWELIDTLTKDTISFTDFGLENGQFYSYYVTAINIYGQESFHLKDNAVNLNFIEIIPKSSGILTEPTNVQSVLVGNDILVTWDTLLEEFDVYSIYRSIGNLHSWKILATVDKNTSSYLDEDLPLIDGTKFYYTVNKSINDADIVVQSSDISPESSISLGKVTLDGSNFTLDISSRRDIKDMTDPIGEYSSTYILPHRHKELKRFDPERIDLNPSLIITDWETLDGRIFTTNNSSDISGTSNTVKVNDRFPQILFQLDSVNKRIVFSEPITETDSSGNVIGEIPNIEVKIFGIEEVQEILETFRFDRIHAKQIAFGRIKKEQIKPLNHEGRIREQLTPKSYLLERYNNYTFVVPQKNTDKTKTFGDGTTFYTVIESDGLIDEIIDWDQEQDGDVIGFRSPRYSNDTADNLTPYYDIAEVTSEFAFQSEKSYHFGFEFVDKDPSRWVKIVSTNTPVKPNPVIDLKKRIKFRIKIVTNEGSGSLFLTLGIREINQINLSVGDDGGISGPIEWLGVDSIIFDSNSNKVPIGKKIDEQDDFFIVEFDPEKDNVQPFSDDANGLLNTKFGVLEHFAFTINPESNITGPFDIYIDKLQQVDDVLVSGTSQGIQISRNFGTSWNIIRYVETPVHKFYKAVNNQFIWAISVNTVLLSVDPANWFETGGLNGVQYIKDIIEDDFGNMFISTDKGVYWFETSLINNFSSWRQTQNITAFTTDCYGLYHNTISSGVDEIWVSTETGVFKTNDQGQTWTDSELTTQGLPSFKFINIGTVETPNIITITRKHILRKLGAENNFSILANLEVQHNILNIWTIEYFSGKLYVSTEKGVYFNSVDELFTPDIETIFSRVFSDLDKNRKFRPSFGLNSITLHSNSISEETEQLFIGQENRLMVSDENNILSIKEEFSNKELPSFFVENEEITTGYIYNAFNNVLSFREPQPINILYQSTHLPRSFYFPVNNGWAQTNPSTDVFIFVNGIPKWLDFRLDENHIVKTLKTLQDKLTPLKKTLNDFNSLYPESLNTLISVINNITNIITKTDGKFDGVNNENIVAFLQNYTRFLSLVDSSVVENNNLTTPEIRLSGIPVTDREANSRAALLEEKEGFKANNSVGITINSVDGRIDFQTIFTTTTDKIKKQDYVFTKYDQLEITIFNSNISGTGEFTHIEIEDKMEAINSGLTSRLTSTYYTNLLKTGIFLENNNHFMFDTIKSTNIQSKYNAAHNNDWYDILNSTVDYDLILKTNNSYESHFANNIVIFTENSYLLNKIWVGTDNDIMQYEISSNGDLTFEKAIRPGSGLEPVFIWDIFVFNENDIYVVAETQNDQTGHIFRTENEGSDWVELETINLPQQFYSFSILNGNKIIATENGIFYSDNDFGTWYPSSLTLSNQLNNNSPTITAFLGRFLNLNTSVFLVTENDKWFYTSPNGREWFGLAGQSSVNVINKIVRFKNLTWIGTDKGLFNDGNSILSDNIQFGLQKIESTISDSAKNISDISVGTYLYCSSGNNVYRFKNNQWNKYEVPNVSVIHKILIHETNNHYLIIISHNIITTVNVTPGTGVFDA